MEGIRIVLQGGAAYLTTEEIGRAMIHLAERAPQKSFGFLRHSRSRVNFASLLPRCALVDHPEIRNDLR
jgi:hypothetical protein